MEYTKVKIMEKIVIFDNSPLVIAGLEYILQGSDFDVVAATSNADTFFSHIILENPDYVIIDPHSMKDESIQRLNYLKKLFIDLKVIIFSSSNAMFHLMRSYRFTLEAYLDKNQPLENLLRVLITQKNDDALTSFRPECVYKIFNAPDNLLQLTNREIQVLYKIITGKTNRIIAEEMFLSNKTVSSHKRNIMHKIGAKSLRDVFDFAKLHGL
ncbi:two-component system response regulator EvgA [Kluyvera sp. 1366]